jgi:ADP-dependent NAD(P)H-hydrate dehydratase / NAD(P)H-hydrate epimerase
VSGETVMMAKGRLTAITQTGRGCAYSPFGGPVLARGGSGDLLAGLTGGLLAQTPAEPLLAACRGAVWHGLAADALARAHGQVAVATTQLLDFLPAALREAGA